jgi:O-methyltransferase involved in polyketide biosynthesis
MGQEERKPGGDISVTALYTSYAWRWGGLDCAELLATPEARVVFRATNFVLGLVRLVRWELPSLRHSLLQRHAMIDHLVQAHGARQVLELASGLSRRGASFTRDAQLLYTELDLPSMVARKKEIFARTPEGRAVAARGNFRLVAGDALEEPLEPLVDPSRPVFVIAEGLLMYLAAPEQRRLWARVAALVARTPGSVFVFDLVPACEQPRPGRLGRMLERMMKHATGGKSFEVDDRTREDIASELASAGFGSVETFEPHQVASAWNLPCTHKKTQVLLFLGKSALG